MRLLSKSIASIAILGAVLAMASSDMEDEEYPDADTNIGHQKEDSDGVSSTTTIQRRCTRKANQDKANNNNREDQFAVNNGCENTEMRTNGREITEKNNDIVSRIKSDWSSMISSEELLDSDRIRDDRSVKKDARNVIENLTGLLTTLDSFNLVVDEVTKIPTDILDLETDDEEDDGEMENDEERKDDSESNKTIEDDSELDEGQDLSVLLPDKLANQLVHLEKIRKPTSSSSSISFSSSELITQVRSAKHITFTSTSEFARNSSFARSSSFNDTTGLEEETLESPPVVSSSQILPSVTRFPTKEKSQDGIGVEAKLTYLKKDHSKPSINLVDGKPSKVFYEIKPSLNTAIQDDDDDDDDNDDTGDDRDNSRRKIHDNPWLATTKKNFLAIFKIPSLPSAFGKFGPYFLDEGDELNITERIGSTVMLDCRIGLLGDKKVTWLQHVKDSIRLLTVGNVQYSADERISLKFQYPDNWRLQIAYATLRDSGLYKCQVEIDSTHSLVKKYYVTITAPVLNITDDSGRAISGERHLKAGSALKLRCEGRDILENLNETLLWTKGDEALTSNVSENRTTKMVADKEIPVIVSTLIVERATPRHAGNYSCTVPERAKTTIAVHVLNGELPAAVHHGNGVSRAVFNFWLIHLTVSSGFFR